MTNLPAARPIGFGQHSLAVLATAIIGSTAFTLLAGAWVAVVAGQNMPGVSWLLMLSVATWIGVFIISLPSAGIAYSLLWPVVRRGGAASGWLCIVAGTAMGILLAPMASAGMRGTSPTQLLVFGVTGAAFGAIYVFMTRQLGTEAQTKRAAAAAVAAAPFEGPDVRD